jgi:two-component system OmpR family sensor kinase
MVSLRARLLVGLLALAAVGLLLLGGITYAEQRSFLMQRVDQQAHVAPFGVARALAQADADDDFGGLERNGRRPPPSGPDTPSGTFGQRRSATGEVLQSVVVNYDGQSRTVSPDLPARLPIGELFTVDGRNGDNVRYRVFAQRDAFSNQIVVAAVPLREVDATLRRLLLVEALVIAGVLAVIGGVAWVVVRIGLLPLDRMGHTAGRIAGGDLSHRVEAVDPRTEVGRLGLALNAMLDRLERAFAERRASEDRLRRFLADASHELRTPLASIRGYAELFRIGAARRPEDTEKAMRRIEDEARRMGVLVEDLLTLARLDQVPDTERSPVDLAELARDTVDDARATAPERSIDLHVDGATAVLGDEAGLRQVLANLLRNALVHTPPDTPIDVDVRREGTGVRAEIRDHGPGLPTDHPEQLFERFWRAEGGRERGRAGAGLGLAIVAGIVDAHGVRVGAANAPGGGASFVVVLPAARASQTSLR